MLASTLRLSSFEFTKTLKLNPIVALLLFKTIPITDLSSHQDKLAILIFLPPILNNIKTQQYKVIDVNSLLHTTFLSYYPDLSEPKPPVLRSSLRKINIEINNLQPWHFLNRPFASSPYFPDIQHLKKKFKFKYFDVTDDECSKQCSIVVKDQH